MPAKRTQGHHWARRFLAEQRIDAIIDDFIADYFALEAAVGGAEYEWRLRARFWALSPWLRPILALEPPR